MQVFINGRFMDEQAASVSVFDRGFLYGDGVFETLRAYKGRIFKPADHIARLFQSAQAISLSIPDTPSAVEESLNRTLQVNGLEEAYLRITVSRGVGPPGLNLPASPSPTVVIIARPFTDPAAELYEKGVPIAPVQTRRAPAFPPEQGIKSLNYLTNILAKEEASAAGAYEGILLNSEGFLCEGTVSNLFLARGGKLLTPAPDCGILNGITRRTVIELALQDGVRVEEGRYRPEAFLEADECFLTNTSIELMPVVKVLGLSAAPSAHSIGAGRVGKLTRRLHEAYRRLTQETGSSPHRTFPD